jgi:hypothetical protein
MDGTELPPLCVYVRAGLGKGDQSSSNVRLSLHVENSSGQNGKHLSGSDIFHPQVASVTSYLLDQEL